MAACYPGGSSAVADEACCVDEVTDHKVLVGTAKVIVHVFERVHDDGFLHSTGVKGYENAERDGGEKQTSCLAGS